MLHANSASFIERWRALRGDRRLPRREDVSPAEFRDVLTQRLMLRRLGVSEAVTLAGGLVTELHHRELRGAPFAALWRVDARAAVADALNQARLRAAPVVLCATAETEAGDGAALEMTLAPLTGHSGAAERLFGLVQPVSGLRRLQGAAVSRLLLNSVELLPDRRSSPLRLVALNGRRVA